jgi:membrane protease YdiL (CAAX protease family)
VHAFQKLLSRHSLGFGIGLIFLLTWPIDASYSGILPLKVPFVAYITIGYGIVFASVTMTWLTVGRGAVVALLKRFLIWRVRFKWYAVALFLFPTIQFLAVMLSATIRRAQVDFSSIIAHEIFGPSAALPILVIPYLLFDALTNGEEIGWRGYVLPRLQARHSALLASLIVGFLWGLWHLPRFVAPGNASSFGWFMVKVILESILYTWLYNNTGGSLLLTTLFHSVGNTGGVFLPIATTVSGGNLTTLWLQITMEAVVAAIVIVTSGHERLSRTEPKQVWNDINLSN